MTGFWGTKFINEQCRDADWILGLGTRFSEADCSSWDPNTRSASRRRKLIHIDIDPAEIGRNYPGRDRRRRRPEAGARRCSTASPGGWCPTASSGRSSSQQIAANRSEFVAEQSRARAERRLPDAARAHPRRRARGAAARRDHHHRRRLEQERRRPAVPDLHAGQRPHARRLRDDGLRRAGGDRRQARPSRHASCIALVGDGGFGQNPAMLATAVEQDVAVVWVVMNNYAFGTIAGLEKAHFGTDFRLRVREGRQALLARLCRDRAGLRRRRRADQVGRGIQARARARHRRRAARSSSTWPC